MIIERLARENDILKSNLQKLSSEINRLKGKQGKPDIKTNKKKDGNISSEAETHANKDSKRLNGILMPNLCFNWPYVNHNG